MSPVRATRANEALRRQVVALGGEPPTDSQLRRWVFQGCLPPPVKTPLGRGRGTVSTYPPNAAARTVKIQELLSAGIGLQAMPAALFVLGEDIAEKPLRAALGLLVDELDQELHRLAQRLPGGPEPGRDLHDRRDVADAATLAATQGATRPRLVSVFARNLSSAGPGARNERALGKEADRVADVQDAVFAALAAVWAGDLDDEALRAMLAGFGLDADMADELLETEGTELRRALSRMTLVEARRRLLTCRYRELCDARQQLNETLNLLQLADPDLEVLVREWIGPDGLSMLLVTLLTLDDNTKATR